MVNARVWDSEEVRRTLLIYVGFSFLLAGNYFLISNTHREPLALSVVGGQYLGVVTGVMVGMYVVLVLLSVGTLGYILYTEPRPFAPDVRVTVVQSVCLFVIAHLLFLHISLFTGAVLLPTL